MGLNELSKYKTADRRLALAKVFPNIFIALRQMSSCPAC